MTEPIGTTLDPTDYNISMDTRYLRDTYGEYFDENICNNKKYYIEKPLSKGMKREDRYVASIVNLDAVHLPTQNLATISGTDIWGRVFSERELEEISKAVTLIRIAVGSDSYDEDSMSFDKTIVLEDNTEARVEYIPYIPENTDSILADMNQHIAE